MPRRDRATRQERRHGSTGRLPVRSGGAALDGSTLDRCFVLLITRQNPGNRLAASADRAATRGRSVPVSLFGCEPVPAETFHVRGSQCRTQIQGREDLGQLLLQPRDLRPRDVLVVLHPRKPEFEVSDGGVRRLDALPHPLGFLLALPEEVPGPVDPLGRIDLRQVAALVAHLGGDLEDLRLEPREIRMGPDMLKPFADAVELALQFEHAIPVGGMRDLVGKRHVPHRGPEDAVRILQSKHPVVHRQEEAQPEEKKRHGQLDRDPGIYGAVSSKSDGKFKPRRNAGNCGDAPQAPGNGQAKKAGLSQSLNDY